MSDPLDEMMERTARLIESVESGVPIDFKKEAKLDAAMELKALIHYAKQAIDRNKSADDELVERINDV